MSQPLFILAPPRSFTSVSCGMIGQHPEMFGLPETNLFARGTYKELKRLYQARGRFQHGLLRSIAQLAFGDQSDDNVEIASTWLENHLDINTDEIFRDLAAWAEPRGLVDKSPIYVYDASSLARIASAFPQARYLHLTRHPRGTCESIYALRKSTTERGERFRQMMAQQGRPQLQQKVPEVELTPETMWFDPHVRILEFLESVPDAQQLRLQGEDLLSDPDYYLLRISEWLEISTEPHALEAMKHPERSTFACFGPNNARFGNDPSFLKDPALRNYRRKVEEMDSPLSWDDQLSFSTEVRELAEMLGYE